LYRERAHFVAPKVLAVGDEQFSAERFVIAAGSRPRVPDVPGIDDPALAGRIHTSDSIMRLATLPTVHGEKIVIRILDKTNALLQLSELGFLPQAFESYERSFRKPYGAILVTGPTGSGKSTTLYATLNIVNSIDRHIVTVEDPVEYRLAGVNQIQVNPKAGLTFASALRSILRADPDIILIGEIRDRETATIAVESVLKFQP